MLALPKQVIVIKKKVPDPPIVPTETTAIAVPTNDELTEKCRCGQKFKPFQHSKGFSKSCPKCLEQSRQHERTRPKRTYRNDTRDPVKRQEWKDLNRDKLTESWIKHRQNKKLELGIDAYREHNAKIASAWRQNNEDKLRAIQLRSLNSNNRRLSSMKHQAKIKGVEWLLTDEYALLMINSKCFYCDKILDGIKNSIDKINSKGDYEPSNCVSCCKICNYMKNTLDVIIMLNQIHNILLHLSIITGDKYTFTQTIADKANYNKYLKNAKRRNIEFDLTESSFNWLIKYECYLCGVEGKSGIDRVDSNKGYEFDNCRACCSFCNYLKRDMDLSPFVNHIQIINANRDRIINHLAIINKASAQKLNYYELAPQQIDDLQQSLADEIVNVESKTGNKFKVENNRKLNRQQKRALSQQIKSELNNKQQINLSDKNYQRRVALVNTIKQITRQIELKQKKPELLFKLEIKLISLKQELESLN